MQRFLLAVLASLSLVACGGPLEGEAPLQPGSGLPLDDQATSEEALTSEPNGTCVHPVTSTGAKLTTTCSACAGKVCAADPYCCNTYWDSLCVNAVPRLCGTTTTADAGTGTVADAGTGTVADAGTGTVADAGVLSSALVNGSFESGLSPWVSSTLGCNAYGTSCVQLTSSGPARTGSWAVRFNLPKPSAYVTGYNTVRAAVKQQVVLPANATSVKAYARSSWPNDFNQQVGLKVSLVTPEAGLPVAIGTGANNALTSYTALSVGVSAYAGKAVNIEVFATTTRYMSSLTTWPTMSALFDDVSVQ